MAVSKLKTAVLISGRGSNLQSLIDAVSAHGFPAEISLVISNLPDAGGLERAANANILTQVIPHKDYKIRQEFDEALDVALRAKDIQLVCLAGFMRLLTPWFVERWQDKLINIHPSLLPSFKGLHTHRQALAAGIKIHGCTVHFVRPHVDDGPIIVQAAVPVYADDTEETLAARVLIEEHKIYPAALRWIAENRVNVMDAKVFLANEFKSNRVLNVPPIKSGA